MKNPYLSLIQTVWRYGIPWRKAIVGYYIAYIIAQTAISLSPYTFGRTVEILQDFRPESLFDVVFWLSMSVVVLLIFWIFHGPARVVERKVALKIQQKYRLHLYEELTRLPLTWHQHQHSGEIITRLNRAAIALRQFAETQFIYIETIVKFFVSLGFLLWLSLPIGLLSLVTSALVTLIVILFDLKLIPLYNTENEIENRIGAVVFDYINNMTTILTLRLGELTHSNLAQRMKAIWPSFRKDAVINEVKWFTMMVSLTLVQAILLIGYIIHSLHTTNTVLIGVLVMLYRYQWDLNTVFHDLSVHYSELVRMDTDVKGMQPILEDIHKLAHKVPGATTAKHWHELHISQLHFNHINKEGEEIFSDMEFSVKRGEKIALIGTSGGGKSTLLNILSGLYTPSSVHLKVDDINFDSLEPLKAITTLIPQDPEIFENTIAFNITMDLPTSEDEIYTAVKLAGFSPVLETLPLGLKTDIREKGLNLSVGQKQRLALTRGLFAARFSSLILMDEPTSSVDLPTEKTILSATLQTFSESAMIVSLHRLHLLPKFDSIIMLSHGKIIAKGPATALLENPGPVRDLWISYQED